MSNYCSNILVCTSGKKIGEIIKPYISDVDEEGKATEPHLDFQKINPMPENVIVENKQYEGMPDWYNWRVENWGTKWNSMHNTTLENLEYDKEMTIEDIETYFFQTAWSPAIPVIMKLAEITGESFALYYNEEGIGFFGKADISPEGAIDQEFSHEKDAEGIDPKSDIYEFCDLENYFENKEEYEKEYSDEDEEED